MVAEKKTNQIDWKKQLNKLIKYSKKNGYEVKVEKAKGGISTICFETKVITIHSRYPKERQLYTLLHELGHFLIHRDQKEYTRGIGYVPTYYDNKSIINKLSEVEEEFEAWRQGRELAKKLKIKIDRDNFEKFKASLLTTYFMWAMKSKINKKIKKEMAIKKHGKRKVHRKHKQ